MNDSDDANPPELPDWFAQESERLLQERENEINEFYGIGKGAAWNLCE